MIKKFSALLSFALAVVLLSSCLGSDDDNDTTYYDDTAIQSFTLGTLKVVHDTIASDGVTDSTYTTSLTGSTYNFNIDQLSSTVYNTDSLPAGTDVSKVLATITTYNSGTAIIVLKDKSGSDSLAYYTSTDSIDYTSPVRLRVYNMQGSAYREYTITLNVHKEKPDAFAWKATTVEGLENVTNRRIYTTPNGNTYLFGERNGAFTVYLNTGNGWREQSWATVPDLIELGGTPRYVYAVRNDSILRKDAYSDTWVKDDIDDSPTNLPSSDANIVVEASDVNNGAYDLALIGNRDGRTVVWSKVEESDNATNTWTYYTPDSYNTKLLPYLSNLRAVAYDGGILATGGDFTKMYFSPDWGLTWDENTRYTLPEAFGRTAGNFGFSVDEDNVMYISKDGSNVIYSGRLARLGWEKQQTVFTQAKRR